MKRTEGKGERRLKDHDNGSSSTTSSSRRITESSHS